MSALPEGVRRRGSWSLGACTSREIVRREVFGPDQVARRELSRKITDVVNELGQQPWQPSEPLDPIEVDEVNLVVWMGVMEAET